MNIQCYNTIIVGSGAAGLSAADRLLQFGHTDFALVTEGMNVGTSRNTGSDKQTYYKLSMAGDDEDSVYKMCNTLFKGGCADGDTALCEAALSMRAFLRLCELGVEFPQNRFGEYIGYKTDHDPLRRATSVGPYTSKMMTEALEKSVKDRIDIFDGYQVISIVTENDEAKGLICLNHAEINTKESRYTAFCCKNIIYATGGPAGIYKKSVYPHGHFGSSGIAFEAGVKGKNLTEWQFGLASLSPRWNVSGTYMQVLPQFVSTDKDGNDRREFLADYFKDGAGLHSAVFQKGYQWPFDVRKVENGSSIIDLLVYNETEVKGRRVFLDFRKNSEYLPDFTELSSEAYNYLKSAGALFGTPIDRLSHMNMPAVELYRNKGVDLQTEMLEIDLCAQHNNGGMDVNMWWESNISGFFPIGEAAGTHGVFRPGGSALNSGQVGALRAAFYISKKRSGQIDLDEFKEILPKHMEKIYELDNCLSSSSNVKDKYEYYSGAMSKVAGAIRDNNGISELIAEVQAELTNFCQNIKINSNSEYKMLYRLRDVLLAQFLYLTAMEDYNRVKAESRGSALYLDKNGIKPERLPEIFRYRNTESELSSLVQELRLSHGKCEITRRTVRPVPSDDDFFENVWRGYRENYNIT